MIATCAKCKLEKEHKIRNDQGGRPQSYCIDCQAVYRKEHYKKNKQRYIDKAKFRRQKYAKEIQSFKEVPCYDCGIQYPFYVMQFDHINGEKEFDLANGASKSQATVIAEISKCEIVCANCHAERTYRRRQAALSQQ